MFGIFTGTLANAGLIIIGTAVGILFKTEKLKKIGERIFQVFALFVMVMGFEGALGVDQPVFCLISIIVGVAIGELLDLDAAFNRFGEKMQRIFVKGEQDGDFAEGFVQASLLFCIGSMAIMGAMQSGLQNEHTIYYTKGVLDMISACTMAMGLGIGVGFSALSILVYQGLLTVGASLLAPILRDSIVTISVQIGSLFLIAIATNMFGITRLKVANFLPAMFIPMLWQAISLLFA